MGIMNKAKTVDLGTLNYYEYGSTDTVDQFYSSSIDSSLSNYGKLQVEGFENKQEKLPNTVYASYGNGKLYFRLPKGKYSSPAAFKSAMQGVLLTYETIDSVEEEIVSYHPQQLVKGENTLIESGGITASFDKNTHRLQISGTSTAYFSRSKHLVEVAELMPNHAYACIINGVVSQGLFLNYKDTEKYAGLGTSSSIVWIGATTGAICYIGSNIYEGETANTDATIQIVDITAIYGAGNEPTPVENFLSQHPEYNSYVPFYDGEINITEEITEYEPFKPVMADNEWTDIFDAFKNDSAPDTWQVGDTKPLELLDGTTYTIRLCDKQAGRYQYSDGSGSSKAVFEFVELVKLGSTTRFNMNQSNVNANGWASSYMRGTTIPNFETFVPEDILAAISRVNVLSGIGNSTTSGTSSSSNKLFVPAEMEMFASKIYSIGDEECPLGQFDYYKAHNTDADRIKRDVGTTTAFSYFLRSPTAVSPSYFCSVTKDGGAYNNAYANYPRGMSFVFAI